MHQRKKIYMDKFIVLCGHDLLWDIKLEEEFNKEKNIWTSLSYYATMIYSGI